MGIPEAICHIWRLINIPFDLYRCSVMTSDMKMKLGYSYWVDAGSPWPQPCCSDLSRDEAGHVTCRWRCRAAWSHNQVRIDRLFLAYL